jgi:hypothetical protein
MGSDGTSIRLNGLWQNPRPLRAALIDASVRVTYLDLSQPRGALAGACPAGGTAVLASQSWPRDL